MMLDLPEWATGGAGGAAIVAAVVKGWNALTKRMEASAAQDTAAAYGFTALAKQVEALTGRCDTLENEVLVLREQLEAEREQREYWQGRFYQEMEAHTATRASAQRLMREWEADKARPSVKSERPGPGSQRKV